MLAGDAGIAAQVVKVKRSGDRDKADAAAQLQHFGIDGDCAAFHHACILLLYVLCVFNCC